MNFDDRKNAMVLAFERKVNEIIAGWVEKAINTIERQKRRVIMKKNKEGR